MSSLSVLGEGYVELEVRLSIVMGLRKGLSLVRWSTGHGMRRRLCMTV
jgi:hypothetical protein